MLWEVGVEVVGLRGVVGEAGKGSISRQRMRREVQEGLL